MQTYFFLCKIWDFLNLKFFEVMLSVKNKQKINKNANLTIENQFTYI